ncbi:membrane-bound inhibitor of C-type lysozyme [Ancylobacter aquaticus]|uniref:Membrane-bound inhibitor of C-type lysozyme n=1 Tax=Ancylobacter aquaticus TaxID=100 RepID=A0A4R1HR05_ANCAQ|nr:MliC family protein [Ancylobacter aquaticus]TCK23175.1 membrane-bound inhibitor of C-type lysozyme [Ancylobacter aquaticus]
MNARKTFLAGLLLAGAPAVAQAGELVIPLPAGAKAETIKAHYTCGTFGTVEARYFNAPPVALASLAFKGEFMVVSNVIAGSGARYAGGTYIWWTKGNKADLYDVTLGEDAAPVASCSTTP